MTATTDHDTTVEPEQAEPETPDEQPTPEPTADDEPEGSDVETTGVGSALAIREDQAGWTRKQREALPAIGVPTEGRSAVPEAVLAQFHHVCQTTGLDPFRREVYLLTHGRVVQDEESGQWRDRREYAVVTGIDGYRALAQATGRYDGQTEAEWCGEDGVWKQVWSVSRMGEPMAARVGVRRTGQPEPTYAVAMWEEYVPTMPLRERGDDGEWFDSGKRVPVPTWQERGAHMLAKVAEALALRKAFPRVMAGVFVAEEMERARREYEEAREPLDAQADARAEAASSITVPPTIGQTAAETIARLRDKVIQGAVVYRDYDEDPQPQPAAGDSVPGRAWLDEYRAQVGHLSADAAARAASRALRLHRVESVEDLPEDALAALVRQQRMSVARKMHAAGQADAAQRYAADGESPYPVAL